ncbi:MAG: hypothetical protein GQ538_11785 [Xanthomonadales bacterium]|nr:hypothetical protein [Xanthomonadales bacterium]
MPHTRPLKFKVASWKDFLVPGLLVAVLVVFSALISQRPVLMTVFISSLLAAGWFLHILDFSKVTDVNLTSVIFPDGSVKLESDGKIRIEGVISGQQWCNSQFAVLRYSSAGKHHKLVLRSAHQNAGDYRRLLVWLRQDLLLKSEGRVQS